MASRTIKLPPKVKTIPPYIMAGSGHIEFYIRDSASLARFRQLRADLAAGATLSTGAPIASLADMFRWFLEQIEVSEVSEVSDNNRKKALASD